MITKTTKLEKIIIGVCIGVLMFFAFSIAVRFLTRQILIKRFSIDNSFTRIIWFDNSVAGGFDSNANVGEDTDKSSYTDINWQELYPFDETENNLKTTTVELKDNKVVAFLNKVTNRITNIVIAIEEAIESYATDLIVFHSKFLECANAYEMFIGWNFAPYDEYNGVIELSDGYLSVYKSEKDNTQKFDALYELNEFCDNRDIDFLYVQAPYKISEYDDTDVSGAVDFTNQNANDLVSKLKDSNIDCYDIRETINESNINNHELFYKTDHHWLTTTGLWASQKILSFCNDKYGWDADLSLLDEDKFDYITYENWFLGSQGKKFTLSRCKPDDFTLLYPKYETRFHYYVPAEGIDTIDDYSVVYNMSAIETCDYYNKNPYGGCNYGDQPLIEIENQLEADNHRILIIHDSFCDCVISCLALAEKNIDSLDIRHFTGSVKAYIEERNPDLVIVMYTASSAGGAINYSTHEDEFDFR